MYKIIIIYLVFLQYLCESNLKSTTVNQNDRIKALSKLIKGDIKTGPISDVATFDEIDEEYDFPLTPIEKTEPTYRTELPEQRPPTRHKEITKKHRKPVPRNAPQSQPKFIFYRRTIDTNRLKEKFKSAHCVDLITPYLSGMWNVSRAKYINENDTVVTRLTELIQLNTTSYSHEDILTIMTQMNDINIRLFQWNAAAVRRLIYSITGDNTHNSFRKLQSSLFKLLFKDWHIEISDIAILLKEMRIFRPPCIPSMSKTSSSTKMAKTSTYPKKATSPTVHCDDF